LNPPLRAQQGIPPGQKPTKRVIPCRSTPQNNDPKEFFNKLLLAQTMSDEIQPVSDNQLILFA
jgi:hypothetical protein